MTSSSDSLTTLGSLHLPKKIRIEQNSGEEVESIKFISREEFGKQQEPNFMPQWYRANQVLWFCRFKLKKKEKLGAEISVQLENERVRTLLLSYAGDWIRVFSNCIMEHLWICFGGQILTLFPARLRIGLIKGLALDNFGWSGIGHLMRFTQRINVLT